MISIIAAIGKNRELGKDNKLLWHIPEDFKRFKDLTSGHVVIMGRKTYESLPEKFRPLPNRTNIVISRQVNISNKSNLTYWANSIEEAFAKAPASQGEIFIIGGASIYQQGIKFTNKLYLTLVNKEYPEADAFFPDYSAFRKVVSEESHSEGEIQFKFITLEK